MLQVYTNGTWFHGDYANFSLDSEDKKYALSLSGYSGNAGDSLTNNLWLPDFYHGGMKFSTFDADNDRNLTKSCVHEAGGGGWWFNNCQAACLTCQRANHFRWYSLNRVTSDDVGRLQAARMMIKSK